MVVITQATIADLEDVASLFDSYRIFYKQDSDKAGGLEFIKNRIENSESVIFIAKDGDAAVGFVQLYPLFSSTRMKRMWLLNDLFVSENQRGKGTGIELISKAQNFAKETGAYSIALRTGIENNIGNKLYPKMGFVLDSEFNHYVNKTESCGLTLETSKLNNIGNALYKKTGFTKDEEHNFYFWDT